MTVLLQNNIPETLDTDHGQKKNILANIDSIQEASTVKEVFVTGKDPIGGFSVDLESKIQSFIEGAWDPTYLDGINDWSKVTSIALTGVPAVNVDDIHTSVAGAKNLSVTGTIAEYEASLQHHIHYPLTL